MRINFLHKQVPGKVIEELKFINTENEVADVLTHQTITSKLNPIEDTQRFSFLDIKASRL